MPETSGASKRTSRCPTWNRTAGRILNLTDNSEKPPGEWNTIVIEGRTLKVLVNGDLVNEGFGGTADRGRIAIQAEGA